MVYKVAIADDNEKFALAVKDHFEGKENFNVVGVVGNGSDLLDVVENEKPDILLLDTIMPMLDGIGVLEKLNENKSENYNPHVVMMSAVGGESFTRQTVNLGADYYFLKPFNFDELTSCLLYTSFVICFSKFENSIFTFSKSSLLKK